jgi:hypothetical protein
LDHIMAEKLGLDLRSLNFLREHLLPTRNPGKRVMRSPDDRPAGFFTLDLLTNACIYRAQQHGEYVPPVFWIEILKRYGMSHRMDRVERLALWLAQHYHLVMQEETVPASGRSAFGRHRTDPAKMSAEVFTDNMLQAFVVWGWRSASVRNLLRPLSPGKLNNLFRMPFWSGMSRYRDCHPWTRGILLLKQMEDSGVNIRASHVRTACTQFLWTMLGPAVSKLRINVQATNRNQLSITHYVQHVNEIWGKPVLDVTPDMLDGNVASEARLLRRVFGDKKLTDQKAQTYADVAAWSADRAREGAHDRHISQRGRRHKWLKSLFRLDGVRVDSGTSRRRKHRFWDVKGS